MSDEFLTPPRLRVLSSVCCDLAVIWLAAILAAEGWLALTADIALSILFLFVALRAEEALEGNLL